VCRHQVDNDLKDMIQDIHLNLNHYTDSMGQELYYFRLCNFVRLVRAVRKRELRYIIKYPPQKKKKKKNYIQIQLIPIKSVFVGQTDTHISPHI
jgi:hypothetical protein